MSPRLAPSYCTCGHLIKLCFLSVNEAQTYLRSQINTGLDPFHNPVQGSFHLALLKIPLVPSCQNCLSMADCSRTSILKKFRVKSAQLKALCGDWGHPPADAVAIKNPEYVSAVTHTHLSLPHSVIWVTFICHKWWGSSPWCDSRECLLLLVAEIMEWVGGSEVGGDGLYNPLLTESEREGGL